MPFLLSPQDVWVCWRTSMCTHCQLGNCTVVYLLFPHQTTTAKCRPVSSCSCWLSLDSSLAILTRCAVLHTIPLYLSDTFEKGFVQLFRNTYYGNISLFNIQHCSPQIAGWFTSWQKASTVSSSHSFTGVQVWQTTQDNTERPLRHPQFLFKSFPVFSRVLLLS